MKLPQLLHSTRSYGQVNSAFSWKLLVLERGSLSYRQKLPCDRSEKDAWFGYSPAGALRKSPFILYSRPAEDWLQRSGSSSTISPTILFFAISARGRRNCSRSSTRRGSREIRDNTGIHAASVAGTSACRERPDSALLGHSAFAVGTALPAPISVIHEKSERGPRWLTSERADLLRQFDAIFATKVVPPHLAGLQSERFAFVVSADLDNP